MRNLYFLAILMHGAIFGFLIVGGQVYVDKKAPAELKAQGQGLFGLMVFGIGMLIGNFFNVKLIDYFTAEIDQDHRLEQHLDGANRNLRRFVGGLAGVLQKE